VLEGERKEEEYGLTYVISFFVTDITNLCYDSMM